MFRSPRLLPGESVSVLFRLNILATNLSIGCIEFHKVTMSCVSVALGVKPIRGALPGFGGSRPLCGFANM